MTDLMVFFFNMNNSRFTRIFLSNMTNISNMLNWSIIQMATSLEGNFESAHSRRPNRGKGFFSPITAMLDQKHWASCPISIQRCRLDFKHIIKMLLLLQSPLRMAFLNINGFAKAKKSNKLHILYHIFLKGCLKKVLKKKHSMFQHLIYWCDLFKQ